MTLQQRLQLTIASSVRSMKGCMAGEGAEAGRFASADGTAGFPAGLAPGLGSSFATATRARPPLPPLQLLLLLLLLAWAAIETIPGRGVRILFWDSGVSDYGPRFGAVSEVKSGSTASYFPRLGRTAKVERRGYCVLGLLLVVICWSGKE